MPRIKIVLPVFEADPVDETIYGRDARFEGDEIYHHTCGMELEGEKSHRWAAPPEESEWRENISDRFEIPDGLTRTDAWAGKAKFGGQRVQER